ncbi:unnamed protein product [Parnassius apollo]|uniref:(apollo) hypothetical protein n=1 Tax=Parnassius apollo TaxID=110799 RepID=A0A8S3XJG4_PARAO|nr:unnamed protein product [Parnassius apollo]
MFSLKVLILLSLIIHLCKNQELLLEDNNKELSSCVRSITKHWFHNGSEVTIVDIDSFDNEIIKAIHSMKYVSIISRTTNKKVIYNNKGYLLTVKNLRVFKDKFNFLSMEEGWKPDVYFLIIFKELELAEINDVFEILLHYHVFKVLVINAASNLNVYTYNPFDNYGCGMVHTSFISYGKCLYANITKSFFYKPLTGLRKCTFKVAFCDSPPFVIMPNNDHSKEKLIGLEQYVLQTLSELEQFNVTYTHQYNPEEGSIVGDDMIASGPMKSIQKGDAHIIIGGLILKPKRIEAFSFLYGHHTDYDGLIILVKKAGLVSNLKNTYIEFEAVVWILLIVAFIIFFVVFVVIYHTKDKFGTILVMWDILLQHGATLGNKLKYRYFMFIWIVFAYLINLHYQSNLSSLATQPIYEYQISNENDLAIYDIKPCISSLVNKHFKNTSGHELEVGNREECGTMLQSITTVSQAHDKIKINREFKIVCNKL